MRGTTIDYLVARLKIDGWAPITFSVAMGVIVVFMINSSLYELPLLSPQKYRISVLMLCIWTLLFSVVGFSLYRVLSVKDSGTAVFSAPLLCLFTALCWVRDDLSHASVMLMDSFQTVDFVARNFSEELFLTDMYYQVQSVIIIVIIVLLAIHFSDTIKGWFNR